ncbi:MAG: hypothetical protein JWR26_3058 [Pedosphaera sp.]|nr:hypothetical protein [Pedosphaera sp.]
MGVFAHGQHKDAGRGEFNHRPRVRDRERVEHRETGMKTGPLTARRRSEVPRAGRALCRRKGSFSKAEAAMRIAVWFFAGVGRGQVAAPETGALLCKGPCGRPPSTRGVCTRPPQAQGMARGGTWAAFGWALGDQAANFVRTAPPKCLLMLPCTCSYRLFFESFIGVLATTDVGGESSPTDTDREGARGPACGTRCARKCARRTGFPSLARQLPTRDFRRGQVWARRSLASQALQVSCPQGTFAARKAISLPSVGWLAQGLVRRFARPLSRRIWAYLGLSRSVSPFSGIFLSCPCGLPPCSRAAAEMGKRWDATGCLHTGVSTLGTMGKGKRCIPENGGYNGLEIGRGMI